MKPIEHYITHGNRNRKGSMRLLVVVMAALLMLSAIWCLASMGCSAEGTREDEHSGSETSENELRYVSEARFIYPTNSRGQTYGSWEEAELAGELPDLVVCWADNGAQGYVYRDDYEMIMRNVCIRQGGEYSAMAEHEEAVNAFCEYYRIITGKGADYQAFDALLIGIEGSIGRHAPWISLTEQQKEAIMNLFPEEYRSLVIAEEAYEVAMSTNNISISVYLVDGETVIGEAKIRW